MGPKKAAAANVETVFSGAGKFAEEADSTGDVLLRRMTRLHYNWNYDFLRPSIESVIKHYDKKHPRGNGKAPAAAPAAAPVPAALVAADGQPANSG